MGIFANLSDVQMQTPNKLPEGTYKGFVSQAKIQPKKDGTQSLIITYRVEDDESEYNGQTVDEWRTIPEMAENAEGNLVPKDETHQRNAQFLKMRLLSLGVREEEMDDVEPKELVGTPVSFSVKINGQYHNIRYVTTRATIGDAVSSDLF